MIPKGPYIIVLGQGHTGTRVITKTLINSGVFMGYPLNESLDLCPPDPVYEMATEKDKEKRWMLAKRYIEAGFGTWDHPVKGWKLPETLFSFDVFYELLLIACPPGSHPHYISPIFVIEWARDPRDIITIPRVTDDYAAFGIPEPNDPIVDRHSSFAAPGGMRQRAHGCVYQHDLIQKWKRLYADMVLGWHTIRYEDYVADPTKTVKDLETMLRIPLTFKEPRRDNIFKWFKHPETRANGESVRDILKPILSHYGYDEDPSPRFVQGRVPSTGSTPSL